MRQFGAKYISWWKPSLVRPEVKKNLWGGNFWSSGYYVATVSEHGNEEVIANYVKNQGNEYKKLLRNEGWEGQLIMFDYL